MTVDEIREALKIAGEQRRQAEGDRENAMTTIAALIKVSGDRISVAELSRLSGVTRQTVYDIRSNYE